MFILPRYQHLISGTRREQPQEVKGGIIADEMGLGKTLVTVASIVGSLDRAAAFASLNIASEENSFRQRSKATLVIVPSSRE